MHFRWHLLAIFLLCLGVSSLNAACLEGAWRDGVWIPKNCSLPTVSVASTECLSTQNVLFLGGSSTRMFFHRFIVHLGMTWPSHHPCNFEMGWGCFDCARGCRSAHYNNKIGRAYDWEDMYVESAQGKVVQFSWKPDMFTMDDIRFLERLAHQKDNPIHAIMVHKGVHTVGDWISTHSVNNFPESVFLEEVRVRAEMLADKLASLFPNAALIWRDGFYHHKSLEWEEMNVKLRHITTPIFRNHGFHILPGFNITAELPFHEDSEDGLHANEAVIDILLSMMATVICPRISADFPPDQGQNYHQLTQ